MVLQVIFLEGDGVGGHQHPVEKNGIILVVDLQSNGHQYLTSARVLSVCVLSVLSVCVCVRVPSVVSVRAFDFVSEKKRFFSAVATRLLWTDVQISRFVTHKISKRLGRVRKHAG